MAAVGECAVEVLIEAGFFNSGEGDGRSSFNSEARRSNMRVFGIGNNLVSFPTKSSIS